MKHKTLQSLLIVFLILPALGFDQTVHQVTTGIDQISAAITGASAGDTLELISDGGVYIETVALVVDKSLTIRAAAGLAAKPVIVTDDTASIIKISDDFTLKGVYLDGSGGAKPTAFGIVVVDGTMGYTLTVEDCEIWDLGTANDQGSAINGFENDSWVTQAEEIFVNNCMFGGMEGEIIRFNRSPSGVPTPGPLKSLYVYGSTFWGSQENEAIYVVDDDQTVGTNDPLFVIDHCTFVNAGSKGVYPKYIDGAIIQNSIITDGQLYFCRIYGQNSGIFNLLWYNCPAGISLKDDATIAQLTNVLNVDPLVADPNYLTSGDFTLSANSPAIDQATDGLTLGDPRWWPVVNGIKISSTENIPTKFQLHQNFPNPFNPSTTIGFDLIKTGHVTLTVYSILGQKITTLVDQQMEAGSHTAKWNIEEIVAGGVYFYKLATNDNQQIRKMVFLK